MHKTKLLGKLRKMTKAEAQEKLAVFMKPVDASADVTVKDFVENVFLPFCRRRWKPITSVSRTDSIKRHIVGAFGKRLLSSLKRDELQQFLDDRKHSAKSMVDHSRWDIKQILDLAVAEGIIPRNPVYSGRMLLFVPKECKKPERPVMTLDEAKRAFAALDLRERVIVKLGVLAGMRVSEIFGLRRGRVAGESVEVVERVCRWDVDSPKTEKSERIVALSSGLQQDLKEWLAVSPDTGPDGWLFPSENVKTPLGADNTKARYIRPRLEKVGLSWVDYRVMRRTHSSLMNAKGVNPKLIADQQGHGVDVNLNVYTQSSLADRLEAVETLETAFVN